MPVPKPSIVQITIPTSNYGGHRGNPSRITFHHIVGDQAAADAVFKKYYSDSSKRKSATFSVSSKGVIHQYVPLDRKPYSDGVASSNLITASIEHAGGLPSVPYTEAMMEKSAQLVAWLIQTYGINDFKRHRDLKSTACPGALDVEWIIRRARHLIEASNTPPPIPTPIPPPTMPIVYEKFPEGARKFVTNKDAVLWDFGSALTWAGFKEVKRLKTGTEFLAVGQARHPIGSIYYMTAYSFDNSGSSLTIPYKPYGVNKVDLDEVINPAPVPPPPPPVIEPPTPVPIPTPHPTPPPAGDEPDEPDKGAIIAFLKLIWELIGNFLAKFKKG